MKRVVVGMSGGVDSFVTALMLKEQGYEVIGVTLALWEKNEISEVQAVCEQVGIPLQVRNGKMLFRETVVEPFVESYLGGYTPSPCCICNRYVKWALLEQAAEEAQAEFIATGHYVRIIRQANKYYIRKGVDLSKDQSYFLWGIPQEILSRAITPLGDYTKTEVKTWAQTHGYGNMASKKESMGICFLRGSDYRDFLCNYVKQDVVIEKGEIIDRKGEIIGEHTGLLNYTVGQKKGLPTFQGQSLYVAEIDVENNRIIADVKAGLNVKKLLVEQIKFADKNILSAKDIVVKIRGLGLNPGGYVKIVELGVDKLQVFLSEPAWAVAPGQPVAFYRDDVLVGGGIAGKWNE